MNNQIIIQNLCIKNDWFTGGDNQAYSKLFELAKAKMPIEIIARCIWLVSDTDNYTDIETKIKESKYESL